jgi:hypothetical protein
VRVDRELHVLGPLGAVLEQRFEFFGFPPVSGHVGSVTAIEKFCGLTEMVLGCEFGVEDST